MKFKIKSLDGKTLPEIEEFKKLGYKIEDQNNYSTMLRDYKGETFRGPLAEYKNEIVFFHNTNKAIKYNVDGVLEPFTKEELKILDLHDWDLHDYMKHPVGQDVTDWFGM